MKKTALLFFGLVLAQFGNSQNQLFIPDTLSGTNINLTLQNGTHQFFNGSMTNTMGANGSVLGPTILLNQGDFVNFNVDNQIGDTTTIHWHGLHVAPENDGGPHTSILPNAQWTPSFTILDKAATYWYHPHLHHKTNEHVSKGIAGMILVRDSEEAILDLPRTYGVDDIPLVIQTKDFDASNQIVVESNSDDVVMTNATIDAYTDVPSQVIRLRILNGSSQRAFNLGLTNDQTFYQIASDGGLLSSPFQATRLLIAPGERAEILIDFTGMIGQTVQLKSYASEIPNGIYGATNPGMAPPMTLTGYNPNPLNGNDFDILDFNIVAQTSNPISSIPAGLVAVNPLNPADANITRDLTFSPVSMGPNQLNGNFLINNLSFDMGVINYYIPLDNIEIWEISNQSGIAHPFHIHDVQFNILTRNGVAPAANELGRKDVVLIKPQETVRFITKFETFANPTVPYMYHCHLITHEDGGMMGQFVVVGPLSIDENEINGNVLVYPNPSTGDIFIKIDSEIVIDELNVVDNLGRKLNVDVEEVNDLLLVKGLTEGVYFLRIRSGEEKIVRKFIVE